jgi:DNA-binding NtrC family response regulator
VKSLPESLEEVERDLIVKALHQHQGIQTKAAENLGISERVLRYKIKKYRIRFNPPLPHLLKGVGGIK